jgi:hypothetical protein
MGYTHYWTQTREFTPAQWKKTISRDVRKIVGDAQTQNTSLRLDWEFATDHVSINGLGADSHEDFWITREIDKRAPRYEGDNPAWSFCKTAQKPYDIVVTAVLCYLASVAKSHEVTSDGEAEDFVAGRDLARQALNNPDIQIPDSIRSNDNASL